MISTCPQEVAMDGKINSHFQIIHVLNLAITDFLLWQIEPFEIKNDHFNSMKKNLKRKQLCKFYDSKTDPLGKCIQSKL